MSRNRSFNRSRHLANSTTSSISAADLSAVKSYWNSLDSGQQLRVLHFDDRVLAERVRSVQCDLCNSDLVCYRLGIRGQDGVRQEVGMDQFALECDADSRAPVAFYATSSFVERADLFEYIESRLGSCFLKGRPVVQRANWSSVFDPAANSWPDFMNQVLRLVELAIFQAHQDSMVVSENVGGTVDDESRTVPPESVDEKSQNTKSKRRARKKRGNAAAAPTSDEVELMPILQEEAEVVVAGLDEFHLRLDDVESLRSLQEEVDLTESASTAAGCTESEVNGPAAPEPDNCLNFDWSPEGPPIDSTSDSASVELEVDWSVGGSNRMQTRWSAWLSNGLNGSAAEWHWVTDGPPTVAYLKNTFVETKMVPEDSSCRARSLPARPRPDH